MKNTKSVHQNFQQYYIITILLFLHCWHFETSGTFVTMKAMNYFRTLGHVWQFLPPVSAYLKVALSTSRSGSSMLTSGYFKSFQKLLDFIIFLSISNVKCWSIITSSDVLFVVKGFGVDRNIFFHSKLQRCKRIITMIKCMHCKFDETHGVE